ncbi:Hypothetical protein D9617_13g101250 [Elsinoe fawcettii]|nr:Hypothetical protein D9617_13g101250 [Elsinoe fawcettii]
MDTSIDEQQRAIAAFFEDAVTSILPTDTSVTRAECDDYAKGLLGTADIVPVRFQGTASYTVFSPHLKQVVQFRLHPIDEEKLDLAHKIYSDLVPAITANKNFKLPVYISSLNEGHVHIYQPLPQDDFPLARQKQTVQDVAKFITRAVEFPVPDESLTPDGWTVSAEMLLRRIIANDQLAKIDKRFAERAAVVLQNVDALRDLPAVITHPNLNEQSLMVEPKTGALTTVLDFDRARVEAFGMSVVGAYDSFFGHVVNGNWQWYHQDIPEGGQNIRDALTSAFWDALWAAMPDEYSTDEFEGPLLVAVEIGMITKYFPDEILDGLDESNEQHRLLLHMAQEVWLDNHYVAPHTNGRRKDSAQGDGT